MCFYHVQYLCCGMINRNVLLFYSQSIVFTFSWFHAISDIKLYNNCCHLHCPITILSFRIHFVFLLRHVLSQWDSVCIPQFALSTLTSHSTSTISSYLWWWCDQSNGSMFNGDMWVRSSTQLLSPRSSFCCRFSHHNTTSALDWEGIPWPKKGLVWINYLTM